MIHEDIQYCLGMVLAGEGDLDRRGEGKEFCHLPLTFKEKTL